MITDLHHDRCYRKTDREARTTERVSQRRKTSETSRKRGLFRGMSLFSRRVAVPARGGSEGLRKERRRGGLMLEESSVPLGEGCIPRGSKRS